MDNLDFQCITEGLGVSFRIFSKVPVKAIFSWDFGDFTDPSALKNPSHTYADNGFYTVTLEVNDPNTGYHKTSSRTVIVSDIVKTHLPDSIYNLVNNYIPQEITQGMSFEQKNVYINKWQLYIQPLVNREEGKEIPIEHYNDELYYEGLENQLIMELAAWDYLNVEVTNILTSTGKYISELTRTGETKSNQKEKEDSDDEGVRGDRVKKITTGPTEVEYFDNISDSVSNFFSTYMKALQPGGVMDQLRKNLCTLAQRLDIYLPFCDQIHDVVIPRVVNRRNPGVLGGPNPTSPLSHQGVTLIPKKR